MKTDSFRTTVPATLLFFALVCLFVSSVACDDDEKSTCEVRTVTETGLTPIEVRWKSDTEVEYAKVHTGRILTPAGTYVKGVGTMPTGGAVSPDGKHLAVVCSGGKDWSLSDKGNQSVRIIDTATEAIVKTLEEQEVFLGAAYSPDGKKLYVSGGLSDNVFVYDVEKDYSKLRTLDVPGYPFGLAVTHDGKSLLVASSHRSQVFQIDTETYEIVRKFEALTYPYLIEIDDADAFAYVTNIASNAVTILDLKQGTTAGHVSVGKNPEGLALYGGKLFVANNDDDTLSVIDVSTKQVVQTILLRDAESDPPGRLPVDVLASTDDKRLYVTLAADNAVMVLDAETYENLGEIPTAFYPTAVEKANGKLYVINAKGTGLGPYTGEEDSAISKKEVDVDGSSVGLFYGGVNIVDVPDAAALQQYSQKVKENNEGALTYFAADCDNWDSPIPSKIGERSKRIRHVVYIVKENKTYDVLLGDLAGEQGDEWHDPSLSYFGVGQTIAVQYAGYAEDTTFDITPNAHELNTRYVDLVNFYDNSIKSTEGHMWLTGGWLNDYGEKFSLLWQVRGERNFMLPNIDPVSTPSTGDLFSYLIENGRSVRVYGEFVGSASKIFNKGYDYISHEYPVGIMVYDDTKKIQVFEKELNAGILRDFTYIWIPNDHTFGMGANRPHPAYMVSDNDEALGRIIDMIAHSPFWNETVVFAFQDDPQNTPDHIDLHRSVCHVAGPWVKRGYRSTLQYDFASLHRTMFQILGVPPISRYEMLAPPMYDVFTTEADFTPYEYVPRDEKFENKAKWIIPEEVPLAKETAKLDFKLVDTQSGLGEILWKAMKGDKIPFPKHLVADGPEDDDDDDEEEMENFTYTDPKLLNIPAKDMKKQEGK